MIDLLGVPSKIKKILSRAEQERLKSGFAFVVCYKESARLQMTHVAFIVLLPMMFCRVFDFVTHVLHLLCSSSF